ncbi:CBS domain-containing protein/sporulation protein YlmC with PRC-barrel domain [Catenulispora sp. GP43]|uniref:magnesium transporter MgtE N-terminal domain-containing protein n=1 Tax=Catenulispora sp. GP43 TaxID=3156263 RepID=UPI003512A02C
MMARRGLSRSLASVPLAARRRSTRERLSETRTVREALVSLAGLVGKPVVNQAGDPIGRVVDLLARWDGQEAYPAITGLVAQIGRLRSRVPYDAVGRVGQDAVHLRSARLDLREFTERVGEAALAADVLDHQLVDIEGVRVVRPSDLYLTTDAQGQLRLVGMDTGLRTLGRRLGPARLRDRVRPEKVIDWSDVQAFGTGAGHGGVKLAASRSELRLLHPAELAELLEDLGRTERRELLGLMDPESAADALEEMRPHELEQLLSETDPGEAAALLARMEPDEAADALRDLDEDRRDELLARMPESPRAALRVLLAQDEHSAGGSMTTTVVRVRPDQSVTQVREVLAEHEAHIADIDSVVIVDADGRLVDDVPLGELLLADPDTVMADLVGPPWPVTVPADSDVREIADRFIHSRRMSVLVLDDQERPVGRILADDVIDMLMPEHGRIRFPRVLS